MEPLLNNDYSVLMSVYNREKPEFLRQSIESMLNQTLTPGDFVLVCDGPLNAALEEVILWAGEKLGDRFQCVRLKENQGLGRALREGLGHCRYEAVARMDSDDISRPGRCELQLQVMRKGNFAVVGGALSEFHTSPGDSDVLRILPQTPEEIAAFARKRNPFNHPCVMFRKDAVQRVGSYEDFPGFEDYHLWVKLIKAGYRGWNIQQVVLDMRVGNGMYGRRGGVDYMTSVVRFQKFLKDEKMIGSAVFICNCMVRCGVSLIPGGMRKGFYRLFLRKKNVQGVRDEQLKENR